MRTIEEVFSDEFSESEEKNLTEISKRYIKDAMRQYAKEAVTENRKNIENLLDEIDFMLAHFEDFTHGETGRKITLLRKMIIDIQNEKIFKKTI